MLCALNVERVLRECSVSLFAAVLAVIVACFFNIF